MTISHKNITNADLHEPKDVSSASVNTVYVADGAGSGDWAQAPYLYSLQTELADISTSSSAYSVVPIAGEISAIRTVLDGAITVADAAITFFINGTPITSSGITVAYSGSAAGDRDSSTPSAANVVAAGDLITSTTNGLSTTSRGLQIVYTIKVGY